MRPIFSLLVLLAFGAEAAPLLTKSVLFPGITYSNSMFVGGFNNPEGVPVDDLHFGVDYAAFYFVKRHCIKETFEVQMVKGKTNESNLRYFAEFAKNLKAKNYTVKQIDKDSESMMYMSINSKNQWFFTYMLSLEEESGPGYRAVVGSCRIK